MTPPPISRLQCLCAEVPAFLDCQTALLQACPEVESPEPEQMPSSCSDTGTACRRRKGRLIDEKRRRRAAEQSLAEVQHQRDRLARRLQHLQSAPHPGPAAAAAPTAAPPTSGADIAVRPAAAALPCSRSGSAEGVGAFAAVSAGTVAGAGGGGQGGGGGGLALYAGQDLQAPARSAFVLPPCGAGAESQLPGSGDGSPIAASPQSLSAPQPVTPSPPAPSPPATCSTPRDMLAKESRSCSPTSYDPQGAADQVVMQQPSAPQLPPPPPPGRTHPAPARM